MKFKLLPDCNYQFLELTSPTRMLFFPGIQAIEGNIKLCPHCKLRAIYVGKKTCNSLPCKFINYYLVVHQNCPNNHRYCFKCQRLFYITAYQNIYCILCRAPLLKKRRALQHFNECFNCGKFYANKIGLPGFCTRQCCDSFYKNEANFKEKQTINDSIDSIEKEIPGIVLEPKDPKVEKYLSQENQKTNRRSSERSEDRKRENKHTEFIRRNESPFIGRNMNPLKFMSVRNNLGSTVAQKRCSAEYLK